MQRQRTFLMVKPDAVQRGLVGEIICRFEKRGFKMLALKFFTPTRALAEAHYAEHKERPFFGGLCDFLSSGPVCAMVWEGNNVISIARTMMGVTKPELSAPGTIRGDFGIDVGRNVIHGSAVPEDAVREIALWFKPEEVCEWTRTMDKHIYE
ncbi:Nucleoside_diphosphate kinase [Hexamita inflata]|uniref:nucleoside-diphosphate kinase n=1 Tax=Hexamita inflata TaxID=28002 RepID=A0AA86TV12_9EUKA|nr:Nucleoside diphosphate kinase [Hexamita inflata]CAI9929920.1 Nucleoside diphosphate kinase [Hexamita inflata]CAI9944740.1 Nucleoside diphosphate kinase [Hexamita inflata]